jgi:hypothetical protein
LCKTNDEASYGVINQLFFKSQKPLFSIPHLAWTIWRTTSAEAFHFGSEYTNDEASYGRGAEKVLFCPGYLFVFHMTSLFDDQKSSQWDIPTK